MNKYIAEFIGTFFLVLVIGMTVIEPGISGFAPLAIGVTLMVMVFATGHISGGHLNPAVTLGVWLRGKCPTKDVVPYMISQVLAALLAAAIVRYLKVGADVTPKELIALPSLLNEFLFTFALVFVVLNTATSKDNAGNSFYGLAIGFTVMAGAYAGGSISGGAYNPAVAVGIITMGIVSVTNIWIYIIANFLGGFLAAQVFKITNPGDLT